jgi:hypothetical protein
MSFSLKLATPPASEPVTTAEAKAHLRISVSSEDTYIGNLITAARQFCEDFTGRAFITQTWELWRDQFPARKACGNDWRDGITEEPISYVDGEPGIIEFPKAPLISVTSVTTYNDSDVAAVFSAASYRVDTIREPGRIALVRGALWPVDLRPTSAIKIVATCGYGTTGASVPMAIRQAILLIVAHCFENREPVLIGTISKELEAGYAPLLAPYQVIKI